MRRYLKLSVSLCLLVFAACDGEIVSPESSTASLDAGDTETEEPGVDAGADTEHDAAPPPPADAGGDGSIQAACVARINAFRATEGKPPLARWVDGEACADQQSQDDANGGGAHGNFGACGEFAQNTCPNWGSTDTVIQGCLQQMWDEGPGEPFSEHGHYINMSSTQYTQVACGFYIGPDGVWSNQNFK